MRKILAAAAVLAALTGFAPAAHAVVGADTGVDGVRVLGVAVKGQDFTLTNLSPHTLFYTIDGTEPVEIAGSGGTGTWPGAYTDDWGNVETVTVGDGSAVGQILVVG